VTCTISYELPDKISVTTGTSAATASAGSTVTITVAVGNRGPGAAGPMSVCVWLPAMTRQVGATRDARRRSDGVCWRRASLAPRKRLQQRVTVRIASGSRQDRDQSECAQQGTSGYHSPGVHARARAGDTPSVHGLADSSTAYKGPSPSTSLPTRSTGSGRACATYTKLERCLAWSVRRVRAALCGRRSGLQCCRSWSR
jgi:Domain of unknown function DUF11